MPSSETAAKLGSRASQTPMVEVEAVVSGRARRVRLKLDGANRWGSTKDRTAVGLLDALEAAGELAPGATVVESSSGNLGVALAALTRERGYGFVAVVDPRVPQWSLDAMRGLGAGVEMVEEPDLHGGYLLARLRRVQRLVETEGFVWTDQYRSPANPAVHRAETGPELWRQTADACDAVFVAVSTGGTLAGVSRYLRDVSPETRVVAVDVVGSVALGGAPGPRLLTGIGSARPSDFVRQRDYDVCAHVTTEEAVAHCRGLAAATGVRVGGSSGAVLAAWARLLDSGESCEKAACLCPDGGGTYEDTIYDDDWLHAHGVSAGPWIEYRPDVRAVAVPEPR